MREFKENANGNVYRQGREPPIFFKTNSITVNSDRTQSLYFNFLIILETENQNKKRGGIEKPNE